MKFQVRQLSRNLPIYIGKRNLIYTKSLDSLYHKIEPLITKQEYASEIKKAYQQLKKIDKGQVSPDFELVNTKNELISLKDHKGKLVYIDVWATWCAPCIKEFPALDYLDFRIQRQGYLIYKHLHGRHH